MRGCLRAGVPLAEEKYLSCLGSAGLKFPMMRVVSAEVHWPGEHPELLGKEAVKKAGVAW